MLSYFRWSTLLALVLFTGTVLFLGLASRWCGSGISPHPHATGSDNLAMAQAGPVLDESEREYLWQVEHHALILGKHWFHDFGEALAKADAKGLEKILAQDFAGQTFSQPAAEPMEIDYIQVSRRKGAGLPPTLLDRKALIALLLDWRREFPLPPAVKVYPKSLAPQTRSDLDSVWRGTGVLRMWGQAGGQPHEVVVHFGFVVPRPSRHQEAGWLRSFSLSQTQIARAAGFFLRDVTRQRNIDPDLFHNNWNSEAKYGNTGGVYLMDFNRDGILDLLVLDINRIALYKGLPAGAFLDVTAEMGLPLFPPPSNPSSFAALADLDGDGWEDLILLGRIYRNEGGNQFVDISHRSNLHFPLNATGVAIADYDRD